MEQDTEAAARQREQTAERLRQFHEESKHYSKRMPNSGLIHSDTVLIACAWILAFGGTIASFCILKDTEALLSSFLSVTFGAFLHVVARIYSTLREIRDRQN